MTGPELQSRLVRALEKKYDQLVATNQTKGVDFEAAHERAFREVLRIQGEALQECRRRGWFPFPEGELPTAPELHERTPQRHG